jgi:hypothetical protein
MLVSLMNLGESQRIFHNRLGRAVAVPVGKIVQVDLPGNVVQSLKFSSTPETIYVGDESMVDVPEEVKGYLDLLHVIEFDSYEKLVEEFLRVAPPNNLTAIRPSRMQMRTMLRTMVEDWIEAQREGDGKVIHDDVDPKQLEKEKEDSDRNPKEIEHPVKKAKDEALAAQGYQTTRQVPPVEARPPARPVKTSKRKRAG